MKTLFSLLLPAILSAQIRPAPQTRDYQPEGRIVRNKCPYMQLLARVLNKFLKPKI
jgi:hypothetical protein